MTNLIEYSQLIPIDATENTEYYINKRKRIIRCVTYICNESNKSFIISPEFSLVQGVQGQRLIIGLSYIPTRE